MFWDGKAGNPNYIPIHGPLGKVTVLNGQGTKMPLISATWEEVVKVCRDMKNNQGLKSVFLESFKISKAILIPEKD